MRYSPAAVALSLLCAVTASSLQSAPVQQLDPRAAKLVVQGRAALAASNVEGAIDAFEAALAIQPGSATIYLNLAEASRQQGMQGKALHYYREVLEAEPQNLAAIAGEGAALAEKGALDKAKRNLARLQGLCGDNCQATRDLGTALASASQPRVITADAAKPQQPAVSSN